MPKDVLSRHVTKLGEKYRIDVPTATAPRRAAATAVSKDIGLQEGDSGFNDVTFCYHTTKALHANKGDGAGSEEISGGGGHAGRKG